MVAPLGQLQLASSLENPVLSGFQQGLQTALLPQTTAADMAAKMALAQYNQARGGYYDQYGNYRQAQSDYLIPSQALVNQQKANVLYPAIAQQRQAQAQQVQALTQPKANLVQAQTQQALAGGPRGQLINNLLANQNGLPSNIGNQAAIATVLQGATPEVKRNFAYQAAQGNIPLQQSIQGANLKATSNQQLLRQQAAMEQFDSAVQPMLQDVGNAVAHYSGPGGALRLRGDQLKQASGGKPSPEYSAYLTAVQTQIPLIADNARKVLGAQASDAMQEQLQGIVGPGGKLDMKAFALMPPQVVYDKLNSFSNYLTKEAQVGRNFVGPLSLNPDKQNPIEAPEKIGPQTGNPPPGMSKAEFTKWYLQNNGGR
jgi:hypothetical protein